MAKISQGVDDKIRQQAKNRCGYCLNPQELIPYKLEIEHIYPKGLGGATVITNLWLACRECNAHKAMKVRSVDGLTGKSVRLFNPRKQNWHEHFEFSQDKTEIIGKTASGRATVESLQMNSFYQKTARAAWVETGKFPPKE